MNKLKAVVILYNGNQLTEAQLQAINGIVFRSTEEYGDVMITQLDASDISKNVATKVLNSFTKKTSKSDEQQEAVNNALTYLLNIYEKEIAAGNKPKMVAQIIADVAKDNTHSARVKAAIEILSNSTTCTTMNANNTFVMEVAKQAYPYIMAL